REEAARREAEAVRIDRERAEAARVAPAWPARRPSVWSVETATVEPANQSVAPVVDSDPPVPRVAATGRLLIAAAALVALIAATWLAAVFPRRAVDAGNNRPQRQAPVAHTQP